MAGCGALSAVSGIPGSNHGRQRRRNRLGCPPQVPPSTLAARWPRRADTDRIACPASRNRHRRCVRRPINVPGRRRRRRTRRLATHLCRWPCAARVRTATGDAGRVADTCCPQSGWWTGGCPPARRPADMAVEAAAEVRGGSAQAAVMAPVAGHLTAAGRTLPGHPVRPQENVAAHKTGRRKQRTVNPPIRRSFRLVTTSSTLPLRPALRPGDDTTVTGVLASPSHQGKPKQQRACFMGRTGAVNGRNASDNHGEPRVSSVQLSSSLWPSTAGHGYQPIRSRGGSRLAPGRAGSVSQRRARQRSLTWPMIQRNRRRGPGKATMAVAHSVLVVAYHVLGPRRRLPRARRRLLPAAPLRRTAPAATRPPTRAAWPQGHSGTHRGRMTRQREVAPALRHFRRRMRPEVKLVCGRPPRRGGLSTSEPRDSQKVAGRSHLGSSSS